MKKIAILIPIHNRILTTQIGIQTLYAALNKYVEKGKGLFKFEVVVTDDGSTDGSSEWIAQNYPDVHLLKGDGNLWWTGAINMGAKYSLETLAVDYILLWNDDISPESDFFILAEKTLLEVDTSTVFGAKIVDINDPGRVLSCGGFFNRYSGIETLINSKDLEKYAGSKFIEVHSLTGMGTFIHKDVIASVGLWDELLPHYKSDSDYILTLKARGYKIVVDLDLIIYDDASKRGISKPKNVKAFMNNLSSVRSPYNLKFLLRYNGKHGIAPFTYYGVAIEVLPIFLGVVKRSIFSKNK
jgi:GT2 family glycosyltransferase